MKTHVCRQTQYGNDNVWLFTLAHRSNLPFYIQLEDWIGEIISSIDITIILLVILNGVSST